MRIWSLPAVAVVLLLSGCATSMPSVRGHYDTLRERIHRAKSQGAMECAPGALATAQAQYRFASMELTEGDLDRAADHVDAGLESAAAALQVSLHCAQTGVRAKNLLADPWPDADGDGVGDRADQCAWDIEDLDGFQDHDGCPEPDNDLDGVLDRSDDCPMDAEDIDGVEDLDGCPELDNDSDGVADADDQCPDEAEVLNDFQDHDGCPDFRPVHVEVQEDHIDFLQPLTFLERSPVLLGPSHPALREVAQILGARTDVRVRISAHTDNRGDSAALEGLSVGRAKAVYDFLVSQGVAGDRMEQAGLGDSDPIATNRTASGRAANNRVEIHVVAGRLVPGGSI